MNTKYQANANYIKRTIAGEHMLIPTGEATQEFNGMVSMNETGAFIWDCLKEPKTVEELVQMLLQEYELEETMALEDILAYLEGGLIRHMIIEIQS